MDLKTRVDELKSGALPNHVAIIPDGNGRWARKQNLKRTEGHKKGARQTEELIQFISSHLPLNYLTFFTFSTENWSRPAKEVVFLMNLLDKFLSDKTEKLVENDIRLKMIGNQNKLPSSVIDKLTQAINRTSSNRGLELIMALNYGGRQEILHAVNKLIEKCHQGELKNGKVTQKQFEAHLFTTGTPHPDLLIRTSGEHRLSNFLLWQMAYTEFWTTETLWPDFTPAHFLDALDDYQARERRYGKVSERGD